MNWINAKCRVPCYSFTVLAIIKVTCCDGSRRVRPELVYYSSGQWFYSDSLMRLHQEDEVLFWLPIPDVPPYMIDDVECD